MVVRTVGGLLALLRRRQLPVAIAVARDERESSAGLASTVMEAAISSGADVVDLGVLPTPAAKLAARRRDLGGAVIVTGSHLDPELNGLKLAAAPTYGPLDVNELFKPAEAELAGPAATRGGRGRVRADDAATQEHVHAICEAIDAERVRAAKLSASASGSAGAGPAMLLEELGCARPEAHPQIGLRLDADGDRLALIDEQGAALDSELTLALCLLGLEARDVVKGADTSRMIDALAEQRGGNVRTVPPARSTSSRLWPRAVAISPEKATAAWWSRPSGSRATGSRRRERCSGFSPGPGVRSRSSPPRCRAMRGFGRH